MEEDLEGALARHASDVSQVSIDYVAAVLVLLNSIVLLMECLTPGHVLVSRPFCTLSTWPQ